MRAVWAATSRSSVLLPTPGSPASRIAAPGTRPPPSTRSSSGTPLLRNAELSTDTWAIGTAAAETGPAALGALVGRAGALGHVKEPRRGRRQARAPRRRTGDAILTLGTIQGDRS